MTKKLKFAKHVRMGRIDYEPKCETSKKLLKLIEERKSFQQRHIEIIKEVFPDISIELV